jgi:hypothetical protein
MRPFKSFIYKLLRSSRSQSGASALEAFFAISLIVAVTVTIVGIASVMNNQAVLNGAAQMAAQQALVDYDRSTYRGGDPGGASFEHAYRVAVSVAREDSRNMIASQEKGDTAPTAAELQPSDFSLECGPDFNNLSAGNCNSPDPNSSKAEKITVTLHAQVKLLMLQMGSWLPGIPSQWTISSTSYAVSEGPQGR